jgi:hypothetical protein
MGIFYSNSINKSEKEKKVVAAVVANDPALEEVSNAHAQVRTEAQVQIIPSKEEAEKCKKQRLSIISALITGS